MRVSTCSSALAAILILGWIDTVLAQWGTIRGQVTVSGTIATPPTLVKKGDTNAKDSAICAAAEIPDESLIINPKSNGLANVVIYLPKKPATIYPDQIQSPPEEVILRQVGCRFVPHVTVMRTNQTLRIHYDDDIDHNPHLYPLKNRLYSVVQPASKEGLAITTLKQPERVPLQIGCDIHPWMRGWIVLQDHPYVAVTNAQGEFEIANLPLGEHDFSIWHERTGYIWKSLKINVQQEAHNLDPIQIPAEKLTATK